MNGDMNVTPRGLQAPHFDHNGVGTRSHRFAVWESALSSYLGAMHGQLGPVALLSAVHEAKQTHGVQHDCIRKLQFPRSTVRVPSYRVYTAEQGELSGL